MIIDIIIIMYKIKNLCKHKERGLSVNTSTRSLLCLDWMNEYIFFFILFVYYLPFNIIFYNTLYTYTNIKY